MPLLPHPEDLPYGTYCPDDEEFAPMSKRFLNPEHLVDEGYVEEFGTVMPQPSHVCTGAECPQCGVLPVGRVTFSQDVKEVSNIMQPKGAFPALLYQAITNTKERLAQLHDSLGNTPAHWPNALLPSVTAIIRAKFYDGPGWQVLCHQRADNQQWGFVGGGQHLGESIIETVYREVMEETGVHVLVDKLACVDSDPAHGALCSYPDGNIVQYCNLTFTCWYAGGRLRASEESLALGWYATDALPQPFLQTHAWRLVQAMGGEVVVR